MKKDRDDDLEELSIQEEIMVENVDEREHRLPTLTILTSDNYLPPRTVPLICSLILCDDVSHQKTN